VRREKVPLLNRRDKILVSYFIRLYFHFGVKISVEIFFFKVNKSLICSSCGRLENLMCTSAKKCLLSSPQKLSSDKKKMHFAALIHTILGYVCVFTAESQK
jgi:hypothetical protein